MVENFEGFKYPVVDHEKCTNCSLCSKVCPVLNPTFDNSKTPGCYAAMASDALRLSGSSSGAVFPVLAEEVMNSGGYVCGAVFDEEMRVIHTVSNKVEDLQKFKGSKYVQSDMKKCYLKIRELLNDNHKVLFVGTPCQVAAVKSYLGKTYENLLTIDIVCHGVPSPKVFDEYLKEEFPNQKVLDVDFRDKSFGWRAQFTSIRTDENFVRKEFKENYYSRAFLSNLDLRNSCHSCPFQTIPRQGDITLGDFWGINEYNHKYNDDKGTSLVLVNNLAGQHLVEKIPHELKLFASVPLQYALKGNLNLTESSKKHSKRDEFFRITEQFGLKKGADMFLDGKYDCAIINYWFSINYGAILTCYALQKLLEDNGYTVKIINYMPPSSRKSYKNSFSEKFAQKYLNLTNEFNNVNELAGLNKVVDTFISGSDQVWRACFYKGYGGNIFHLNFVATDKRKIAFSASFGLDKYSGNNTDRIFAGYYTKKFDSISVREDSGLKILKETFGIDDAEHIIEPVFSCPMEHWNVLAGEKRIVQDDYIAYHIFNIFPIDENLIKSFEQKFNLHSENISASKGYSVEVWLNYIKNSKLLISNSFHAICFAIIFNKPFILLSPSAESLDVRFRSLFKSLNITPKVFAVGDDCSLIDNIIPEYNYEEINKIIAQEREKSLKWLKNAINKEKKLTDFDGEISDMLLEEHLRSKLKEHKRKLLLGYIKYSVFTAVTFGKKRKYNQNKAIFFKRHFDYVSLTSTF